MKSITFSLGISLFFLVMVFPGKANAIWSNEARLDFEVVDEHGLPIEGANIRISFVSGSHKNKSVVGQTDEKGQFSASAVSDGHIGGGVHKEDYYSNGFHTDLLIKKFGRFQPWPKEISVVMRPIVNPVPMYVRNMGFKFPAFGSEVGFDLVKSDWVIPYGQGTHSDFIFKVERRYDNTDNYEVDMTLTFSNIFDGIQAVEDDGGGIFNVGSKFRLPRNAPEDGYQSKLQKRLSRGKYGHHSDNRRENNYIFRVRSEVDENGNLVKAMYGKIRGDVDIYASGEISMHYYLNPDYTRNLEWDPKRNLSPNLTEDEKFPNMINTMP